MSDRMRPLLGLTKMVLDAELAKLRALSDETRRRQDEIADLQATLAARSADVKRADPATDLSLLSGRDAHWQSWVGVTRRRLTGEAAEIAARREAQRLRAQRAFGQVHALDALSRLAQEEERRKENRKSQT